MSIGYFLESLSQAMLVGRNVSREIGHTPCPLSVALKLAFSGVLFSRGAFLYPPHESRYHYYRCSVE